MNKIKNKVNKISLSLITCMLLFGLVQLAFADTTTITILPDPVDVGTQVTFTVNPGTPLGVSKYAYIWKDSVSKASITFPCNLSTCYSQVSTIFTIPTNWVNGVYTFRVFDNGFNSSINGTTLGGWITKDFTVQGSSVIERNTTIDVSPNPVTPGTSLGITVTPSNDGVGKYIYLYNPYGVRKATITLPCASICNSTVSTSYIIPTTFYNGDYKLEIWDYKIANYVVKTFTVTDSSVIERNTSIEVSPNPVNVNTSLFITVTPSNDGVSKYMYLYDFNNKNKATITLPCATSICTSTVSTSYLVPTRFLNGDYQLRVWDYKIGNNAVKTFTVTGSSAVQKNATVTITPNPVNIGNPINIAVSPGIDGVYNYGYLYKGTTFKTNIAFPCTSPCYDDFIKSYTVPTSYGTGSYNLKVYDYTQSKYIDNLFSVI